MLKGDLQKGFEMFEMWQLTDKKLIISQIQNRLFFAMSKGLSHRILVLHILFVILHSPPYGFWPFFLTNFSLRLKIIIESGIIVVRHNGRQVVIMWETWFYTFFAASLSESPQSLSKSAFPNWLCLSEAGWEALQIMITGPQDSATIVNANQLPTVGIVNPCLWGWCHRYNVDGS